MKGKMIVKPLIEKKGDRCVKCGGVATHKHCESGFPICTRKECIIPLLRDKRL